MTRKRKKNGRVRKSGLSIAVFLLVLVASGAALAPKLLDYRPTVKTVGSLDEPVMAEVHTDTADDDEEQTAENYTEHIEETSVVYADYPVLTDDSERFSEEYDAKYALLFNVDNNEIIAYRNESVKMYPASLTKVMTLIVAVENTENFSDTILITDDMVYPMEKLDASRAGFQPGDTPTVEDVLYGMILPSGADAALAAAKYAAGSEKAFVELMNKKAAEMGLADTHFVNVTGLHNKEHYSTARDMAMILKYAMRDDMCRKILSTVEYEYEAEPTELYPEGLIFRSTIFSRMYGDEMPCVVVKGGKTGFTDEAGNCIESFAEIFGKTYILVMCGGTTNWNAIYNTLSAYSVYCAGGEAYKPSEGTKTKP